MDRVKFNDALEMSRLVYGMWRLGDDADTSVDHIRNKISACLDQGITTMDQADIYGGYEAEEILGTALTPELRNQIEIVTKCDIVAPAGRYAGAKVKHYDTSRAHILSSVDHSLRLMKIDHIDLLLIHRPDPLMDHHETGSALDEVVASGKVRAVGVSNFRPWDWELLQSGMKTQLVTNQIEISLLHHTPFTNGDIAFHQKNGQPPMAWSPLGGGALFDTKLSGLHGALQNIATEHDVEIAAVAIAWLLAHPARILPVLGTNNLDRIARIGDAAKIQIDRETWFDLYTHALGHEVA
ncbi:MULTISPECIES: aldo/keto reductase [Alphaproteobacteria]|uniref:Aldo/keto reductase n=1 Tax=Marivita cryptomonadis TaxID=505252 RepID=A0A9Q2PET3_9RHOB|nr:MULTISPECIES: aldo/keto reductase [Marivita]MCR9170026.1 aldo/keto reductase [Paracoccaceae bacterium]MBM2324140.1 aldo/keto reductase [Marivita cryptomonadis]MBM2333730.1 aldo/keto reductase [Marivita cryptomonadis]MBM2343307.1 aldo/keto reductase [Marivita cryptomonadis]MBM2347979.1 aldo/keto reductase [Marivita cryptomonadis]